MIGTASTTSSTAVATDSILHRHPPYFTALAQLSGWSFTRHYLGVVPAVCHPHSLSGLAEATIPAHVLHQNRTCSHIATSQPH